jgi:hypothetical protein
MFAALASDSDSESESQVAKKKESAAKKKEKAKTKAAVNSNARTLALMQKIPAANMPPLPPSTQAMVASATANKVAGIDLGVYGTTKQKQGKTKKMKKQDAKLVLEKVEEDAKLVLEKTKNAPIIGKFFLKNRSKTLKKRNELCGEFGYCFAVGANETDAINIAFEHATFKYLVNRKRIGTDSQNGYVNELRYQRDSFHSFAILKSTRGKSADNLMYEYWVGLCVNKFNRRFSCFVETYGLFKSNGVKETTEGLLRTRNIGNPLYDQEYRVLPSGKNEMTSIISNQPLDWNIACKHGDMLHLLIQQIPTQAPQPLPGQLPISFPIDDLFEVEKIIDAGYKEFIQSILEDDLVFLLYQLYKPLSVLAERGEFTHYDLHTKNVVVYCPDKTKYIHYRYVLPDKTIVEFLSPFIVKIIDYGSCYANGGAGNTSNDIATLLADAAEYPNCKYRGVLGFRFFPVRESYYLKYSNLFNKSHDLRLANYFKHFYDATMIQYKAIKLQKGADSDPVSAEDTHAAAASSASSSSEFFPQTHRELLSELLKKVVYGKYPRNMNLPQPPSKNSANYSEKYEKYEDTIENMRHMGTADQDSQPGSGRILNVIDMANALEVLIRLPHIQEMNETKYAGSQKRGTLTTFCNGSSRPSIYVHSSGSSPGRKTASSSGTAKLKASPV